MTRVLNLITHHELQRMLDRGWRIRRRERLPDRELLLLHHPADHVETYRSLPLDTPPPNPTLF